MIFLLIAVVLIFIMYKFFSDRDKMLVKQTDQYGGILNKYRKFIDFINSESETNKFEIVNSTRDFIHFRAIDGYCSIHFYVTETFGGVQIEWKAFLAAMGNYERKWFFDKNVSQEQIINTIQNDLAKVNSDFMAQFR